FYYNREKFSIENYLLNNYISSMYQRIALCALFFISLFTHAQQNDAKMNSFVSSLMGKMTLDEKIGQLNLLTPGGGVATGAVVSSGVESKIRAGSVGRLFGV